METVSTGSKSAQEDHTGQIGPREVIQFLKFAWPRMLAGAGISTALAFAIVNQMPRTYTATAAIIYDPSSAPAFYTPQSRWLESSVEMSTRIESQVEVIKSVSVANAVIAKLGLARDPELTAPRSTVAQLLNSVIPAADSSENSADAVHEDAPTGAERAVPVFLRNLSVRRVGLSAVVEISYKALDPGKATSIANTVAEMYINSDLDQKAAAARSGSAWLQDRLEQMRMQTFNATRDVEVFKMKGGGEASASEYPVRLAELESVAQTYRRMYESLLLQLTDTLQKVSYPVASARIVSMAAPTRVVTQPNVQLALAFAATLGAALGAAASLMQRSLDRHIRSLDDLAGIGVPVVGKLDRYSVRKPRRWIATSDALNSIGGEGGATCRRVKSPIRLIGNHHRLQLSRIMTAIDAGTSSDTKTIGIVGLDAGSGATTLAVLLAERYAATGHRTLLIDSCIGDPAASRELAPDAPRGLSELLLADENCHDENGHDGLIVQSDSGFSVLPAGRAELPASAGEMLASPRRRFKISDLSQSYDICLIDLPPLSRSADAQCIAPLIDAVVLVAACGEAQAPELVSQIEPLQAANANLIGIVLNKTGPD